MSYTTTQSRAPHTSNQESLVTLYGIGVFQERCMRKSFKEIEAALPHVLDQMKHDAVTKFRHIGPGLEAYCAAHPQSVVFNTDHRERRDRYKDVSLKDLLQELETI